MNEIIFRVSISVSFKEDFAILNLTLSDCLSKITLAIFAEGVRTTVPQPLKQFILIKSNQKQCLVSCLKRQGVYLYILIYIIQPKDAFFIETNLSLM